MKSVQIWSYFWSVFSPNTGKYGPEKTPYLDNFHAVNMAIVLKLGIHNPHHKMVPSAYTILFADILTFPDNMVLLFVSMTGVKAIATFSIEFCSNHKLLITRLSIYPSIYLSIYLSTSSPANLFAIRGKRKRGPGTLQTRDQYLPK